MELSNEQLEEITRLGAAAFTPRQTAYALGFKPSEFMEYMQVEDHPACIAYFKGFYSSELAVKESVMLLARQASSPAQTLAVKMFEETRKTLRRDGIAEDEVQ